MRQRDGSVKKKPVGKDLGENVRHGDFRALSRSLEIR